MDMEQQRLELDSKLANKTLLLNQEEEEEEEEEVGVDLLARGSSTRQRLPNEDEPSATGAEAELEPAPTYGAAPEMEEKEDAPVTADGGGNSVYFDKLQGTESIKETNEMQPEITKIPSVDIDHQTVKISEDKKDFGLSPAPVAHLHEAKGSFKHFENVTEAEVDVDLIEEIEEDSVDLHVERVLDEQNTHDLYCPNCNSCITKRVILIRRRSKVQRRPRPKRGSKVDPIPDSAGFCGIDDTPEIHSDVSPVAAPAEQYDSREQEQKQRQEALSCLSCFSLFIPIGNGCFKMLQSFGWGRQTDCAQSDNTQSPQVISQEGKIQSPQGIIQDENAGTPQQVSHLEDGQSPQHIIDNEDAQKAQPISWNEDKQSPQKIGSDENAPSPQDINQNNNKQSPQKITTVKTNWFFSIFASKSNEIAAQESSPAQISHAITVQSAAVLTPLLDKGHIDGAAIEPKLPGISVIFPSTDSTLLDKLKTDSTEQKTDVDMLQRIVGDSETTDIETGLREPTVQPGTDVAPSSERTTETELIGTDAGEVHEWEILKSIVYGGLIESIASLGVVSSAAGAGADTLNILALGVANLIGGLIVIFHNLRDLRNEQPRAGEDRYQALLGRRQNFVMHVIVAVLSFLVFGLVPPVVYGFSFRTSDDKDLKLAAVAGASLICIFLLALGKGHVSRPHRTYFRSVCYYISLGITGSGISYVVGQLVRRLLEKLGLFDSSSTVSLPFLEVGRASY